jgi:hypothetical protein
MLVTNPQLRASLPDILNHPWMTRGFNGSPDPHLLRREPLRADELDRQVIRHMTGFEFGTEDDIERRLVAILESEAYRRAVQYWENKRERPRIWNDSLSNSSLAIAWDGSMGGQGGHKTEVPSTPKKNRRFSGFDFYRRKLFSPSTSPPSSPFASPSPSQSHLSNTSLSDINQKEPPDPTRGYHPLVSIYYLAREKLERDRVYGAGHFASSQLSVNPPQPTPEEAPPPSASKQSIPIPVPTSSATPQKAIGGADYNMRPSRLPAPETLHYSKMSYDVPVSPSPTTTTFPQRQQQQPQFRARDVGLPAPKHVDLSPPPPITVPGAPDSVTGVAVPTGPASATLPRAPPASTHRRSHSVSQRQGVPRGLAGMFGSGAGGATGVNEHGHLRVSVNSHINGHERPRTAGPVLTTFAERMEDEEAAAAASEPPSSPPEVVLMPATPPTSAGATLVRRFGNLLVGGGSVRGSSDRASKRTSIFGSPRPSADLDHAISEKEKEKERRQASSPQNEKAERPSTSAPTSPTAREETTPAAEDNGNVEMQVSPTGGISHSQTQPLHRRAATILDPQGHAKRHERRSSTGGALLSTVGGTIGRHRRPSTSHGPGRASQFERERPFAQTNEVPEEGVLGGPSGQGHVNGAGAGYELTDGEDDSNANAADKDFKPLFLKGLFRYVRLPKRASVPSCR